MATGEESKGKGCNFFKLLFGRQSSGTAVHHHNPPQPPVQGGSTSSNSNSVLSLAKLLLPTPHHLKLDPSNKLFFPCMILFYFPFLLPFLFIFMSFFVLVCMQWNNCLDYVLILVDFVLIAIQLCRGGLGALNGQSHFPKMDFFFPFWMKIINYLPFSSILGLK